MGLKIRLKVLLGAGPLAVQLLFQDVQGIISPNFDLLHVDPHLITMLCISSSWFSHFRLPGQPLLVQGIPCMRPAGYIIL